MGRIVLRKVGTFEHGTESRSSPEERRKVASISLKAGAAWLVYQGSPAMRAARWC
jgi:hypothetical protein